MTLKKEHLALLGVLFLLFGIELILIQRVVLTPPLSRVVVERIYPEDKRQEFITRDEKGGTRVRPVTVEVPDTVGHCVATSGLVLLLFCFIQIKPD